MLYTHKEALTGVERTMHTWCVALLRAPRLVEQSDVWDKACTDAPFSQNVTASLRAQVHNSCPQ